MALNENNNGNESKKGPEPAPRGFQSVFGQFAEKFAMGGQGDSGHLRLEEIRKLLTDCINASKSEEYRIDLVTVNDSILALPAIAVCVSRRDAQDKGMAVHTLIIEPEGFQLPFRSIPKGRGEMIHDVERVPGEVMDNVYVDVVMSSVRQAIPDVSLREGGFRVVWSDTEFHDPKTIHALAFDAVYAAQQALLPMLNENTELELAKADRDVRFSLVFDHGHAPHFDVQGNPIRSDVRLMLKMAMPPMRVPSGPNNAPREMEFGTVHGFFDIVPMPDNMFMPRFVITDLAMGANIVDAVSTQLLLIAMTTTLSENGRWQESFLLSMGPIAGMRDLKNIHPHLNANTEMAEAAKMLAERFKPGLIISMDAPNATDASWRFDIWAAAANGVMGAHTRIVDAGCALTAGAFERHYGHSSSALVVTEQNAIPLGYYIAHDGEHHDIREVDDLFVNTLMRDGGHTLEMWRDTYLRTELPVDVRLYHRKKMISAMLGRVHYRDTGTRVTFQADFLRALQLSLRDVGFMVSAPESYIKKPATYDWDTVLGGEPNNSGLFREPFRGQPQGPSFANRPRWQ